MSSLAVAVAASCAAFAAWIGARLLVRMAAKNPQALDDTWGGLRKLHTTPVPRIGGIAICAGIVAGAAADWALMGTMAIWPLLLPCAVPGLVWGLIEDVWKRGAVMVRLGLTAVAAAMGFVLLDARITLLDVPLLDDVLIFPAISFVFTVFAVTGVAHSMNVIDGLNGLSGFIALLGAVGLALVALAVGDTVVFSAGCVLAAAVAGFLLVNYPRGKIFLGDGGAYLVGLLLAELAVTLVHRNSEISPWFPLVLLAYPVWETLFSMYRRRMRGYSTGRADALHLHTLVYRRVVRWRGYGAAPADAVTRNSLASLALWVIPAVCFAAALLLWKSSDALQVAAAVFAVFYMLAYRRLVHFGVPAWMVVRAKARAKSASKSLPFGGSSNRIG